MEDLSRNSDTDLTHLHQSDEACRPRQQRLLRGGAISMFLSLLWAFGHNTKLKQFQTAVATGHVCLFDARKLALNMGICPNAPNGDV
jgi:hypothetical protein